MLGLKFQNLVSLCALFVATATGLQADSHEKRVELRPSPITSTVTTLTPQFFTDQGSERVKVAYGPFIVPSTNINNGMKNFTRQDVTIGCKNCTITYIQAGLEYPNGTYANVNTSLWLHHVVLYNLANLDTVCGYNEPGERFFASGNERSPANLCMNGADKAGYYVGPTDEIAFLTELMNTETVNQTAIVTITYEYLPGSPSSFHKVTPVWLDITGCGDSEEPPENNIAFNYTSPVWTANVTGRVTVAAGHIHDGGVNLDITKNNSTLCDCVAAYGQNSGYMDSSGMSMPGMPMANMGMHISSLSQCSTGQVNMGDNLTVTAFYNTTEYMPMMNTNGSLAPIMGIALLYLAQNETYTSTSISTSAPTATGSGSGSGSGSGAGSGAGGGVSSTSSHGAAVPMITSGPFLVAGALGIVALGFA